MTNGNQHQSGGLGLLGKSTSERNGNSQQTSQSKTNSKAMANQESESGDPQLDALMAKGPPQNNGSTNKEASNKNSSANKNGDEKSDNNSEQRNGDENQDQDDQNNELEFG